MGTGMLFPGLFVANCISLLHFVGLSYVGVAVLCCFSQYLLLVMSTEKLFPGVFCGLLHLSHLVKYISRDVTSETCDVFAKTRQIHIKMVGPRLQFLPLNLSQSSLTFPYSL